MPKFSRHCSFQDVAELGSQSSTVDPLESASKISEQKEAEPMAAMSSAGVLDDLFLWGMTDPTPPLQASGNFVHHLGRCFGTLLLRRAAIRRLSAGVRKGVLAEESLAGAGHAFSL